MEYLAGDLARSLAGHDKGKLYVITKVEDELVFLSDGRLKKLSAPKKKKKKHVQLMYARNDSLKKMFSEGKKVTDEAIRLFLKRLEELN